MNLDKSNNQVETTTNRFINLLTMYRKTIWVFVNILLIVYPIYCVYMTVNRDNCIERPIPDQIYGLVVANKNVKSWKYKAKVLDKDNNMTWVTFNELDRESGKVIVCTPTQFSVTEAVGIITLMLLGIASAVIIALILVVVCHFLLAGYKWLATGRWELP